MAPEDVPLLLRRDGQGRVGKVDSCHEDLRVPKTLCARSAPSTVLNCLSVSPIRLAGKLYQYVNFPYMSTLRKTFDRREKIFECHHSLNLTT